jgi:Asp-tRNA(Asn)/Glu-tRNA(Gln) amidotransferase A subunit family amidase
MATASAETSDITWLPARQLATQIADRRLSAESLIRQCLDRINRLDSRVHAFITLAGEQALAEAREADRAVADNRHLGPLHGIPVALKDEIWTRDILSTAGSLIYRDFLPRHDAAIVQRLRAAGAIIIGKTQMPEFAMWPRSVNRLVEEARNPYDNGRIAGASSGGSAVSVATGMVPLAVGSDGGGSVRIPAALCGVIGLHPTPGLVPDQYTFSYSPHASLGPMARTAGDTALLLQVMADPQCRAVDYSAVLADGIEGLKVAWTGDFGWIPADTRVIESARRAALRLREAGAIVEEPTVQIDDIWPAFSVYTRGFARYEAGVSVPFVQSDDNTARCLASPELLMPGVADLLSAPPPSAAEYRRAKAAIERARAHLETLFARYDVICSPTMATVAPPIPEGWGHPYADAHMGTHYTSVVNVAHGTAASYPCGLVDGLPAGLQIMAPGRREDLVLRMCRALELIQPWSLRPPANRSKNTR